MLFALVGIFEGVTFLIEALSVGAGASTALGIGALIVYGLNFFRQYWFYTAAAIGLGILAHTIYNKLISDLFNQIPEPLHTVVMQGLGAASFFSTMAWLITFADMWFAYKTFQAASRVRMGLRGNA